MFGTARNQPLFPGSREAEALATWRDAASLVASRWDVFLAADPETRTWAFAAYVAALDAEEAAADDLAAMPFRVAA
jgi:hypothetical protein